MPLDPRWAQAETLDQLGVLVVEWLQDQHATTPFQAGQPDPETQSITSALIELNRSGFLTDFSQPGEIDGPFAQRAAVTGYCDRPAAERLASVALGSDLIVVSEYPGVHNQFEIPITREAAGTFTILAGAPGAIGVDEHNWPGLNDRMRAVLLDSWYVNAFDPVWGRNDRLWPQLIAALGRADDDVRGSLIDHAYLYEQRALAEEA